MGYSNNLITAPVGIGDISQALNNSSTDLGTLCNSNSIKKWAKYKPEHWSGNYSEVPIWFLTDSDRRENHYGLEWFKYRLTSSDTPTAIEDIKTLMLGATCNGLYTYLPRDTIFNNQTLVSEPKRIADFLAFDTGSSTPYTSTKGYYHGASGPISTGHIYQGTYNGNGASEVGLTWATTNVNSIGLSDFVNIVGQNDALYYGVLFVELTEDPNETNYKSAYDILNEQTEENKIYKPNATLVWHRELTENNEVESIPIYTSCSTIDEDDIYNAGLTPSPYQPMGGATVTNTYYYIVVPVLFRGGIINNLNKGYENYSLNFNLTNVYTNIKMIPLPISPSYFKPLNGIPFIGKFSANGQEEADLKVSISHFIGGRSAPYSPYIDLESIYIKLRGTDDTSALQMRVYIDFYYGSEPTSSYNPESWSTYVSVQPTPEGVYDALEVVGLNQTGIPFKNNNNEDLRCRVYLDGTKTTNYEDIIVTDKLDGFTE